MEDRLPRRISLIRTRYDDPALAHVRFSALGAGIEDRLPLSISSTRMSYDDTALAYFSFLPSVWALRR